MKIRKNIFLQLVVGITIISIIAFNLNNFFTQSDKAKTYESKKDRPDLAAAQDFEMTKDLALGYPPIERKVDAFKVAQKLIKSKGGKAISNVLWNERGPDNVGGRTRAIIFDPNDPLGNKVFAGAVSGGLWYNNDITDSESQWQNINDFMANLSISTMAYDPINTLTFYAGTGLGFTGDIRGAGIWKTIDGGTSWNQLESTKNDVFNFNQKIIVTNTSKVIVATLDGLQISEDGGESWTTAIDEDMTDLDKASDDENNEVLYASNYSGDIYRSNDDGITWTNVSPNAGGDRVELSVAPSDPLVIYAVAANGSNVAWFKKSIDAGDTWTDITIPNYKEQQTCEAGDSDFTRGQAFFDLILGVSPINEDFVIVGGIDLHRSNDGGETWELISYWTGACAPYVHADQHAIVFKNGSDSEAIFGNDGGVFYSNNLDQENPSFLEATKGYNTTLFYATAMENKPVSNKYLAGAQDNGTQLFSQSGINSTTDATGGDGAYCFIDQNEPNIIIASYVYNNYYISTDGISFNTLSSDGSGNFINQSDYDSDANILYATGNSNQLIVYSELTSDNPQQEKFDIAIGNNRLSHLLASPNKDNRLFVGTNGGKVFVIDNANTNPVVTNIDNNQLPGGNVSSIDIGNTDQHLLLTYSNYGITSVWETIDGGNNWNNKEGNLPDIPVRWCLYNPNNRNEVLLATELGVWSTDDISSDTPEWNPTSEGLANVRCDMLQYRSSDQQVAVATFGRGLFTSNVFTEGVFPSFNVNKTINYIGSKIDFSNNSIGQIDNFIWDFGDGTTSTESNVSHTYNSEGTYLVVLSVNNGEESISKEIKILPNRNANYSLADGGNFEQVQDFIAVNQNGSGFTLGNSSIEGKSGTNSGENAWVLEIEEDNYVNNSTAFLYSPHFDFSTIGNYEISFFAQYKFEINWDGFIVEYTLDSGSVWTKLNNRIEDGWYNEISDPASVFGNSVPMFTGSTENEYIQHFTDVSFLAENPRIGFRIKFLSDPAETDVGLAIDDFTLSAPKTDAVPNFSTNLASATICLGSEITFYDQSQGEISSYNWNFGNGATPATATGPGPHKVIYSSLESPDVTLSVEGTTNGVVSITKSSYLTIESNTFNEKTISIDNSEICYGEEVILTIADTDVDVVYQLFDQNDEAVGAFKIGDGNSHSITTQIFEDDTFYLKAKSLTGICSTIFDQSLSVDVLGGSPREVVLNTQTICMGETIEATIINAEENAAYFLYNTVNSSTISDSLTGTGGDLLLESYPLADTANVTIKSYTATCETTLNQPVKINVKPLPIVVITANGSLLESTQGGQSYQWYLNGEAITGQTLNNTQANSYGEYTVEIRKDGCSNVSEPFTPLILGVKDLIESGVLKFYPNPTYGAVNINHDGRFNYLKITNSKGQTIESRNILSNEVISLYQYHNGLYIFELRGEDSTVIFRINKVD